MKNNKLKLAALTLLLTLAFYFLFSTPTQASIIDNIKSIFSKKEDNNVKNKDFTIDSQIELAPEGDENKDGEIDAGDIVRFTYTLKNITESNYSFATLKTNIDSKQVSFIHNIHGATGIVNDGKTVEIPYVRLNSGETLVINFDALINYFQEDKVIATEAEFVSFNKESIAKSARNEISAKKLTAKEVEERGISIKKQ